jgi:hypothetical protein
VPAIALGYGVWGCDHLKYWGLRRAIAPSRKRIDHSLKVVSLPTRDNVLKEFQIDLAALIRLKDEAF